MIQTTARTKTHRRGEPTSAEDDGRVIVVCGEALIDMTGCTPGLAMSVLPSTFGAHRETRLRVPAPQVLVLDTIGAGDPFGAALLAWLDEHECLDPNLHLDEPELLAALDLPAWPPQSHVRVRARILHTKGRW